MKKYFILYTRDFSNTYDIVYAETPEQEQQAVAKGYERITRREAERLCRAEMDRRQDDPAFSGYASAEILPIWYPAEERDWRNDSRMVKNGCIVERI